MKAVILAGGFGKRLMPLTSKTPKPMLKICNTPMIDYCISQASYFGIRDITLTLAYLPEKITDWCNGYRELKMSYFTEKEPLGTFGGVKEVSKDLGEDFFVLSGDGLNDIDLNKMAESHFASGADVTIAVTHSMTPHLYGVVEIDGRGLVSSFYEKPTEYRGNTVNTGVYIIKRRALELLPPGNNDFARDLFPLVLKNGKINTYRHEGYWNDIGNPQSYYESNFYVKDNRFFPPAENSLRILHQSREENGSVIAHSAVIKGSLSNCIVGDGCRITGSLKNCIVTDGGRAEDDLESCIITPEGRVEIFYESVLSNAQGEDPHKREIV